MDPEKLDEEIKQARMYSNADNKFQNTSLGGNYAVNMPPQFTHIADPLIKGQGSTPTFMDGGVGLSKQADENGMGRYYSEAIDDTKELIHLRFGVAEFNSLTRFFMNSYDSDQGRLARRGESSSNLNDSNRYD